MATTQIPIKGVFDTATGALTGIAVSGGAELQIGGGETELSASALLAAKRAGTLQAGKTYRTTDGQFYYANSSTNFWPREGSPILTNETVTIAGDSFNANAVINTNRQSTLSIIGWASTQLPVPLEVVAYRAVAGQSWATVMSGQVAGAIADASDIVWINCGANVWLPVSTSSTVDKAIADMKTVLDALSPVKQLVICNSSTSGVMASHDRAGEVLWLNERMKALCATYPNVVFNDTYPAMVDTTSANGDVLASATYDGLLHPNMKGAQRIGQRSVYNLADRVRIISKYTRTALTGAPTFTGTGGTKTAGSGSITGNAPDNIRVWVSSGSAAVTLTSKTTTGSAGNRLGVVIANAGGADSRVDIDLATTNLYNSQLVAGDRIQGYIGLRIKSITALKALYATMTVTGGGGTTTFGFSPHTSADPNPNAEYPYVCRIAMPPQVLGAGFTAINIGFAIQVAATTGAADIDVWDFGIDKLT